MAQNNPFFGNPLDKATDEIRARNQQFELPDFSEISAPSSEGGAGGFSHNGLLPPPEIEPLFIGASTRYQVPMNVLMAIGQQESSYNPGAIGVETKWGRAKGMMQYIDPTAEAMGIDPLDPAQSVDAAARQFKERLAKGYSVEEAIMAHHGGDDRRQWGPKTREYAQSVMAKAKAIREQWKPTQQRGITSDAIQAAEGVAGRPQAPRGVTSDAIRSAEQVAEGTGEPLSLTEIEQRADRRAEIELDRIRRQVSGGDQGGEIDAMTGPAMKTNDPNAPKPKTPLDLVREGLGAAKDFLQTPASEIDFLTRRPEGPKGGEKRDSGILAGMTDSIDSATEDPAEFTGERARDERQSIDAYTGAAPKLGNRTWMGWVENLAKSVAGGFSGSTGATVEGAGLITQQVSNVEAGRQLETAAKKFDGARRTVQQTIEANENRNPREALERVQGHVERMAEAEKEFHQAVVEWAEREPNKVAEWLRGMGADINKLAEAMQADPEYQGVATDLASGVGSMLTYLGPGFLSTLMTRGSTAAMRSVASIAAASSLAGPAGASEAYNRAIEYGLSEEEALEVAMKGIPAGIVQVAPVAAILRKVPEGVRSKAVAQFRHLVENFGAEFTAEGAGVVMQNLVEKSYNKDKGIWDDSLYQAAIGGSSAALISLGIQIATRGRGIGPISESDVAREMNRTLKGTEFIDTPEMEALRRMDPDGYVEAIKREAAARNPESVLDGDVSKPAGPAPQGPIERAATETAGEERVAQVPGERVTVQTPTGEIAGTVEDYFEDGEGGFQVQVLSDDGEQYVFDQDSQAAILRDSAFEEAGESDQGGDRGGDAAGGADVPPMADVEAGESPGEAERPDAAEGDQEQAGAKKPAVDGEYKERVRQRTRFLGMAETTQDVEDLMDAELEDAPGLTTQDRQDFIDAAYSRIEEIQQGEADARRASFEEGQRQGDSQRFQRDPLDMYRFKTPNPEIAIRESRKESRGAGQGTLTAFYPGSDEVLARGTDMEDVFARAEAEHQRRAEQGQQDAREATQAAQEAEPELTPAGEQIVPHTTKKGKNLRGVLRDIPLSEAKKIDPYAFRKNGRSFIRLDRLDPEQQGGEITAPGPDTQNEQTVSQDTGDKPLEFKRDGTPFKSYEAAQRAIKNRRISGSPVQVDGGWAIQRSEAPAQEPAPVTNAITRDNAEANLAPARWRGDQAKTVQYVNALMERGLIEGTPQLSSARDAGDYQAMAEEIDRQLAGEAVRPATVDTAESAGSAAARQRARNDRTPPIADARREDRKRDTRKQGREAALEGDPRELPEWLQGDAELESEFLAGYGEGIAQRSQQQAEPQWWQDMTPAKRYDAMQAAGINKAASTPWSRLTESQQRTLDAQWGEQQTEAGVEDNAQDTTPVVDNETAETSDKPQASDNTIFTEDAAEKARALLKSKLGQINSGLDPEMFQAGIVLAGYHVERNARSFAAYARAMVDDLGDAVKPHLKQFYMGLKYDPRATGFEGMDSAADVDAADVDAVLAETTEAPAESAQEATQDTAETTDLEGAHVTPEAERQRLKDRQEDARGAAETLEGSARHHAQEQAEAAEDAYAESVAESSGEPLSEDVAIDERAWRHAQIADAGLYTPDEVLRLAQVLHKGSGQVTVNDVRNAAGLARGQNPIGPGADLDAPFHEAGLIAPSRDRELADAFEVPESTDVDAPAPSAPAEPVDMTRPTDEVLRPEGKMPRWRTENAARKYRDQRDLLGIYEIEAEGKGFILRRLPTFTLTVGERVRYSKSTGSNVFETFVQRPEGMSSDLFKQLATAKMRVKPSDIIQENSLAKADIAKIQKLADHLEAEVVDTRDEEDRNQYPIRGGSRDDAQGDSEQGTQTLVDTSPESHVPAEPGADPARVDGVRPSREAGDGQPDPDRTRRADGLERGEVAGAQGAADAGGGRGGSGPRAGAGIAGGQRSPASDSLNRKEERTHTLAGENPGNFQITEDFGLGTGTDGQKIKANLEAIEIMKRATEEGRFATPEEQAALARYVGWGGLAEVFDPKHRGKSNQYGRAYARLKELLTPDEFAEAQRSIQDAHYTSETVVGMMWDAARHFGFTGGRALEPTSGSGNFIGLEPSDLAGATEWFASELDSVSGNIARLLYPDATVLAGTGFQDAPFADGVMDLAIGNPPFGIQRIRDRSKHRAHLDGMKIHNYIIAKAGMHLRPGGVMQMVVTHRFLDTADTEARAALAKEFRFLGAVRLPNNAFKANAGTEVTTDVVFLQKRHPGEEADTGAAWLDTDGEIEVDGVKMRVNRYYQEHPENILGKSSMTGSMYTANEYTVEADGRDIQADFQKILTKGSLAEFAGAMTPSKVDRDGEAVMLEQSELPVGGMRLNDEGRIIIRDLDDEYGNAVINEITPETYWREKAAQWEDAIGAVKAVKQAREDGRQLTQDEIQAFLDASEVAANASGGKKPKPTKAEQAIYDIADAIVDPNMAWTFDEGLAAMEATLQRKQLGRKGYDTLRKLLDLRNKANRLLHAERTDAPDMEQIRSELNQAHDEFVAAYGYISDPANLSLLSGDVGIEVGLEKDYDPEIKPKEAKAMGVKPRKASAKKADILERRVIWPNREIDRADNALDGMNISLSERGRLDFGYIAGLTGKTESQVIEELSSGENPAIFFDPEANEYTTADEYLSGNVKMKLAAAYAYGMDSNAKALEEVQPEPKGKESVTPSIRGTWIPASIFEDFLSAIGVRSPKVLVQPEIGRISARNAAAELTDFGVQFNDPDVDIIKLFNSATAGKSIKITRRDSEGGTYEDKNATKRATAKAERMAEVFAEWAYSDPDRTTMVVDAYNEKMNTHRQRTWNGEKYLKTVGQSPAVKLRRTQKNAAWRMIQSQNVLTDHVVGAGKTFTLITGIMERKRLGLSRKPAIIVPNHLVVQWASEFYQLYPGARILAATPDDFAKKNRRRMFARIATGDYDAVIMGHSSFGFIEPADGDVRRVINDAKTKLQMAMEDAKQAGESGRTLKQMQKKLDGYDDRLKSLSERERDEMGVDFEGMGIDYLAVDEAHMFKNLEYATAGERVVGMNDPKGSKRAFDLYTKVRGLQERNGGVTFATGTPVSNSLVELYTMMRYLGHESLKARNQDHFDAWAGAYAVTETRMEYTATQKLKPRRVLSGLSNLDGLGQLYREFADIITMDDLKRIYSEEKREANKANGTNERTEFPVPKVKGGGRQLDTADITEQQSEYMDYLVARMKGIEQNKSDPAYARIDNPLWVLTDARKMSLDVRIVDPSAERDENGKVMRSARRIKDLYDRWDADKGTQMVFSDLSTPSKTAGREARKIVRDGFAVVYGEKQGKAAQRKVKDLPLEEQWKRVQSAAEQVMDDPAVESDKVEKIEAFLEANATADATMVVADKGFSVYDDLRQVLVEMGIPEHEIAFIHDYNTPEQKSRLFSRVNSGAIRVLIGSTEKMGAGTNAQERLVGLHHLDAPWRPSDVEQREGRIIRQGNKLYERDPDNFEVEIHAYSTNGTSDTVMWQVLERKAAAIEQFRQAGLDSMREDDSDSDQYAEFMASSTGNPVFRLKLEAEREVTNLQAEIGGKLIAVQNARNFMGAYENRKASLEEQALEVRNMEVGEAAYGEASGTPEGLEEALQEAQARFAEDYAAWEVERDKKEREREKARAEGKKKLPAIPAAPRRPTMLSPEVVDTSGYAQAVKALLEDAAAGNKGDARTVRMTIGTARVSVSRHHNPFNDSPYYIAHLNVGDKTSTLAKTEAKNPADAPTLIHALSPESLRRAIADEAAMVDASLKRLESQRQRNEELAKEQVDDSALVEAREVLDWYQKQVKIAEYEADVKRGQRQNRYIESDNTRNLGGFTGRAEAEVKKLVDTETGESFTTTGSAISESHVDGRIVTHDATRDSDGRRALVREHIAPGDSGETTAVIATLEPDKVRQQMRSAVAKSVADRRPRAPKQSAFEASQRIRQGRLGEVAGRLLDSGKIRITETTPADVPRNTAAFVDEQGVINLVARNLDPQNAEATLLHEAFHSSARPLIGTPRWNELQDRLAKLYRQAERSSGYNRQFWDAAMARIALAEASGDVMTEARRVEEFGAYALEEFANAPATLRKWASEMAGRVKAWLQRNFGLQAGQVTPAQLRALAAAALRNGEMAPSPALTLTTGRLVDENGNPVSERERKAEANKAIRSARKALSVVREDGVNDRDGGITRDILKITAITHQPYNIASMEPQFTPVFRTAMDQMRFRDTIISEMYPRFQTYRELRQESRARVNKVLELGRLSGLSFSDARLRKGVENTGFKTVIVYDPSGRPIRRQEPLHTSLSERGEVISLTEEERTAYRELRAMFDEALDRFRDQTLIDLGMVEFVGSRDPVGDIMAAITSDMSDAKKERYTNVAKMAEEIEQAKRTGYVPLNRYGRFVITVKEKIADVKYAKNPGGGFIARGVPDDLNDFMREIGASWNDLEGGWQVSDGQRRQLHRETTRTVYSEKLDPEGLRQRKETWSGSKSGKKPRELSFIKERIDALKEEWGGPGRTVSVLDTKQARIEGTLKLSDIDTLADMAQIDTETWDRVRDDFVKAMRGRGFRKHFFRAENVPGYDTDFERAIADYIASMAGYLSRRHHEKRWEDAIGKVKGPNLNAYSKEYRQYVNDPAEELAVLRQTGFLFYIAGNVSTALLNATQVPIMTMPALTQVMVHGKALKEVTRAYKDALAMTSLYDQMREGWQRGGVKGAADSMLQMFDPNDAPEDVRAEVLEAWEDGMFAPQFTHEVMGFSNRRDGSAQAKLEKSIDYIASSYTYIERLNRLVTFIAAARAAKDPKVQARANETLKGNALARMNLLGDNWSAKAFGEFIVDESQFMMGKVNRAKMLRGPGAAVFQFMSFVINSLQAWWRWSKVNGGGGKRSTAYSLLAISALSGIWGVPGLEYLRQAIEAVVSQITGEDEDFKYDLREWVGRVSGQEWLGQVADKGGLYPLGLDMSGRIGFMRMLPDMSSPVAALGVPADLLLGRPYRAVNETVQGDYAGAISELSPNFLRNPISAYKWSQEGVVSRAGNQTLTPEQIPTHALWLKAFGIQPSIVSDAYDYKFATYRMERAMDAKTRRYVNRIARAQVDAMRNENPDRQAEFERRIDEAVQEVIDYNTENPSSPMTVTPDKVRNKVTEYLYGLEARAGTERKTARASAERAREVFNIDDVIGQE